MSRLLSRDHPRSWLCCVFFGLLLLGPLKAFATTEPKILFAADESTCVRSLLGANFSRCKRLTTAFELPELTPSSHPTLQSIPIKMLLSFTHACETTSVLTAHLRYGVGFDLRIASQKNLGTTRIEFLLDSPHSVLTADVGIDSEQGLVKSGCYLALATNLTYPMLDPVQRLVEGLSARISHTNALRLQLLKVAELPAQWQALGSMPDALAAAEEFKRIEAHFLRSELAELEQATLRGKLTEYESTRRLNLSGDGGLIGQAEAEATRLASQVKTLRSVLSLSSRCRGNEDYSAECIAAVEVVNHDLLQTVVKARNELTQISEWLSAESSRLAAQSSAISASLASLLMSTEKTLEKPL